MIRPEPFCPPLVQCRVLPRVSAVHAVAARRDSAEPCPQQSTGRAVGFRAGDRREEGGSGSAKLETAAGFVDVAGAAAPRAPHEVNFIAALVRLTPARTSACTKPVVNCTAVPGPARQAIAA